jgi:hypothetical protein
MTNPSSRRLSSFIRDVRIPKRSLQQTFSQVFFRSFFSVYLSQYFLYSRQQQQLKNNHHLQELVHHLLWIQFIIKQCKRQMNY